MEIRRGEIESILSAGYKALEESPIKDRLTMDLEAFIDSLKGYDILGLFDNDKPAGMFFYEGQYLHMAILPEYRGKWAHLFPELLQYGLDKYKKVLARIHKDNIYMQKLAVRAGFSYKTTENEYLIYEMGEKLC